MWPNWIKVTQSQVTVSKSIAILITLCKEPCDQIVYKSRYHKIDPSQVFAPKTCPKLGWKQPKESPSCSHITLAISHPSVWRTIKEIVRVGKYPELGTSNQGHQIKLRRIKCINLKSFKRQSAPKQASKLCQMNTSQSQHGRPPTDEGCRGPSLWCDRQETARLSSSPRTR